MVEDDLTFPDAPRAALDHRIADMMAAAEAFRREEARLLAVTAAIQSVAIAPGLDPALVRSVESAVRLTGASSGSLVVLDDRGRQRTVRAGAEAVERDPATSDGELVVPIRARGEILGELRLAGARFSAADAHVVEAVATTTGAVVEQARLLDAARRAQRWAAAANELVGQLLDDLSIDAVHTMTDRLLELADAEPGYIAFLSPQDDSVAVHGLGRIGRGLDPHLLPLHGTFVAEVGRSGDPVDLSAAAAVAKSAVMSDLDADGPVLGIPVPGPSGPMGVLVLRRARDAPGFDPLDAAMAVDFVGQVSRAMRIRRILRDRAGPAAGRPSLARS